MNQPANDGPIIKTDSPQKIGSVFSGVGLSFVTYSIIALSTVLLSMVILGPLIAAFFLGMPHPQKGDIALTAVWAIFAIISVLFLIANTAALRLLKNNDALKRGLRIGFAFILLPLLLMPQLNQLQETMQDQGDGYFSDMQKSFEADEKKDATLCASIRRMEDRSLCFYNVATQTNDFKACLSISADTSFWSDQRDYCLGLVGGNLKDVSICNYIADSGLKENCLGGIHASQNSSAH
jgi:hypothetical protein